MIRHGATCPEVEGVEESEQIALYGSQDVWKLVERELNEAGSLRQGARLQAAVGVKSQAGVAVFDPGTGIVPEPQRRPLGKPRP